MNNTEEKKGGSMYAQLGVDANKKIVREIFGKIIDNDYPGAFVNIIADPFNEDLVVTDHIDGDGSKFVQRLLHYFETGDDTIFKGMVDDALSMNTSDIAASGFVFGPWIVINVLNVNLNPELKAIILKNVAERFQELKELYAQQGFRWLNSSHSFSFLGGETADLPDQVRSAVFDIAVTAWADKNDIVSGNVQPGDKIYGFGSDGQAIWETKINSGIMSNGLTLARSCLMSTAYNQLYPQLKRDGDFYKGRHKVKDLISRLNEMTVSEAILSPTRQWAFVIRDLMENLQKAGSQHLLHGISMNTGGGATKIKHVGRGGINYVKFMPALPVFFRLIAEDSGEKPEYMYQNFNCGIGIDIVGAADPRFHEALLQTEEKLKVKLYELGECHSAEPGINRVTLETPYGLFHY